MSSLVNYLLKRFDIKIKSVASYNHQSVQAKHEIKSAYNTFNSPYAANYSPYELVLGRKPKLHLYLEPNPNFKVSGIFKDYYIC